MAASRIFLPSRSAFRRSRYNTSPGTFLRLRTPSGIAGCFVVPMLENQTTPLVPAVSSVKWYLQTYTSFVYSIAVRKPSPETESRRLKYLAKSKETYMKALIVELRERRRFGGMLSNIAFNLAQKQGIDVELKNVLDECRKGWDSIRSVPL